MKHPNPARITAALNAANEKLKTSNGLSVCIPPIYLHTLMDCGAWALAQIEAVDSFIDKLNEEADDGQD